MKECIFCEIINNAASAHVLYENDFVVAFLSLENHPLIAPKKHIVDIFELDDFSAAEIMKAAVVVSKATRAVLGCDGINLIQSNGEAAGQDVFHFHFHIKPRWQDDRVNLAWDNTPVAEFQKKQTLHRHCSRTFVSVGWRFTPPPTPNSAAFPRP